MLSNLWVGGSLQDTCHSCSSDSGYAVNVYVVHVLMAAPASTMEDCSVAASRAGVMDKCESTGVAGMTWWLCKVLPCSKVITLCEVRCIVQIV